jgi:hypothetical protein
MTDLPMKVISMITQLEVVDTRAILAPSAQLYLVTIYKHAVSEVSLRGIHPHCVKNEMRMA